MLPIVPKLPVVYILVGNTGHGMDHISAEKTIKFPKNMIFLKTLSCQYYGTTTRSAISRGGGGGGSTVSDGKGLYQQACQEEWKKCKKEEE
jgi:hypothetical protein